MKKLTLTLNAEDKVHLLKAVGARDVHPAVWKRATILLLFDQGRSCSQIAKEVRVDAETSRRVRKRYLSGGVKRALFDAPRSGAKRLLQKSQEASIIELVQSPPPQGYLRWSARLLVEQVLAQGIAEKVGEETIRLLLHKYELRPVHTHYLVRRSKK